MDFVQLRKVAEGHDPTLAMGRLDEERTNILRVIRRLRHNDEFVKGWTFAAAFAAANSDANPTPEECEKMRLRTMKVMQGQLPLLRSLRKTAVRRFNAKYGESNVSPLARVCNYLNHESDTV